MFVGLMCCGVGVAHIIFPGIKDEEAVCVGLP